MNTQQAVSPVVVVGSVAIDWIITPRAERKESVGGSATFFSFAAAPFCPVRLVGVVGGDFPKTTIDDLREHGVDTEGLEVISEGLTFRWKGRYHENMSSRDTLETHLNVFESFRPKLPESYRNARHLFLANIQPDLQLDVLGQMNQRPDFVAMDTMNLWIDIAGDSLRSVLAKVDCLLLNEEEARQLSGCDNLVRAARDIQKLGPTVVVIKQGEYGALMFGADGDVFSAPALPLESVSDPTGAGDCFAGGFMGAVAKTAGKPNGAQLRGAVMWGSVMASYCVEAFSYDALKDLPKPSIVERYERFVKLADFPRG